MHCKYKGTFMCRACKYCRFMHTQKNPILPNGKMFYPKHFANCKTIGVIYMLKCSCGCFYIGKTKLEFQRRAYRHIRRMQVCNPDLPSGHHVFSVHSGIFPNVTFVILNQIHPSPGGGIGTKSSSRWSYDGSTSSRLHYLPGSKKLYVSNHSSRVSPRVEWKIKYNFRP